MEKKLIILIVFVAIVIVATLWIGFYYPGHPLTLGSQSGSSNSSVQSIASNWGGSYMTQSEAQGLLGTGGSYSSSGTSDPSQISTYLSVDTEITDFPQLQPSSVSQVWLMYYRFGNPTPPNTTAIAEQVLQSPTEQQALQNYDAIYSSFPFTVRNATYDGMTYSFCECKSGQYIEGFFVGYKGNEVTGIFTYPSNILTPSQLAPVVAGDMP